MLQKSMEMAVECHESQFRKGSKSQPYKIIPYVFHVFEVTKMTSELGVTDEDILSSSMLHDYIEDCYNEYTFESKHLMLKRLTNERIADIVLECSRDGGDHVNRQHKLDFLMSFESKSVESIIVKIADRYCNVKDYLSTNKKKKYASQYAMQAWPIYNQFQLRKEEFEDYCSIPLVENCIKELSEIILNVYDVDILNTTYEEIKKHVL
jgi:(p)ppGpp synthase/HD superfamily hydrolase